MTGTPAAAVSKIQWSRQGQEAIDASYGRITTDDPAKYRTRGVRWTFGDVIIGDTMLSPCRIAPTNDDATGDQNYITVFFVLSGSYTMFGAGDDLVFGRGAAGWMPGWTRVAAEVHQVSRLARISVPRIALRGADQRHPASGIFLPSLSLTTPALSFVLELMHAAEGRTAPGAAAPGRADAIDAEVTGAVLTQLVAGLFLEQSQRQTDAQEFNPGLWARAGTIIDREYADPLLDPGALADRLHVSLRHLQRAFAQHQCTISDAIRERRASAVVELLGVAPSNDTSLSDIAGRCGFTSIKEMRFALRTKYGMTPRELRSASQARSASG